MVVRGKVAANGVGGQVIPRNNWSVGGRMKSKSRPLYPTDRGLGPVIGRMQTAKRQRFRSGDGGNAPEESFDSC